MANDGLCKNTLVPLLLRAALGVIFLYHGLNKVTDSDHELGATWASHLWERQEKPPADVLAKLDLLPEESPEKIAEIKEKLRPIYARESGSMPASLQYHATQLAVAWGELLSGFALLIGMLTRLSALAMVVIQAGAIATTTWSRGFSVAEGGGYEYNLALLVMCLAVALSGGGSLSLDQWLSSRRKRRAAPPSAAAA